ncbi:twin-arginine translocation signal domain-containing protein, partial [Luteitalea sp.]|uniref:twin-arginine translocation signal domain-containing protein n=1 Tax=Luteitalea sp. TaxID=2004800 RepID=UPI0037C7DA9E
MPDRRQFLHAAGASAVAATLPARSYARILGANDRVRVGIVGFSDRCRGSLIPAFQQHAAGMNFELVAVSDIWSLRREAGSAALQKLGQSAPIVC